MKKDYTFNISAQIKLFALFMMVLISNFALGQSNFSSSSYRISTSYGSNSDSKITKPNSSIEDLKIECDSTSKFDIFTSFNQSISLIQIDSNKVIYTGSDYINTGILKFGKKYKVILQVSNTTVFTFSTTKLIYKNFEKVKLSSADMKNDTLYICRYNLISNIKSDFFEFNNSNSSFCSFIIDSLYSYISTDVFYRVYKNNKLVLSKIGSIPSLKEGDKIFIKFYKFNKNVLLNRYVNEIKNYEMLQQTSFDSIVSQSITIMYKPYDKLPKPTFLNNINTICSGDPAVIIRDKSLKNVYTKSERFYLNDSNSTYKTYASGVYYLQSFKTQLNGCYAFSDTLNVFRKNCGFQSVNGKVYQDINKNYKCDDKDLLFKNVKVYMRIGDKYYYTFSDINGEYQFKLATNTITTNYIYVYIADLDYNIDYKYGDISNDFSDINIETYKLSNNDLNVNLTSGRNRPGFTIPLYLNIENKGKLTNSGTVTLILDPNYTYVNATPSPSSINGNTITWITDDIQSSKNKYIYVNASISASLALGTTLTSTMSITPKIADVNSINNQSVLAAIVTGSYDPNDIAVNPQGTGIEGFIKNNIPLDYLVRCQNSGTDTAFTVKVKVPISSALDISTLKMIDASHNYSISIDRDTLVCLFNNINLPDSTTNEAKSHAHFHFSINQKANNAPLTKIEEFAAIYFDYNAPVITNKVLNTIEQITNIDDVSDLINTQIYPNPTNGIITISTPEMSEFSINNSLGEKLKSGSAFKQTELDLSELPKGIYYIQLINSKNKITRQIILK